MHFFKTNFISRLWIEIDAMLCLRIYLWQVERAIIIILLWDRILNISTMNTISLRPFKRPNEIPFTEEVCVVNKGQNEKPYLKVKSNADL